jgi:hypothetical protein
MSNKMTRMSTTVPIPMYIVVLRRRFNIATVVVHRCLRKFPSAHNAETSHCSKRRAERCAKLRHDTEETGDAMKKSFATVSSGNIAEQCWSR